MTWSFEDFMMLDKVGKGQYVKGIVWQRVFYF